MSGLSTLWQEGWDVANSKSLVVQHEGNTNKVLKFI